MQHCNSILAFSWAGFCLPWLAMSLAATPNAFQITGGSTVSVFNTGSLQETGVIGFPLGSVNNMVLSPHSNSVFLAGGPSNTPAEANVSTGLLTKLFNVTGYDYLGPIALSPDGKTLYISALGPGSPEVFVVDVASGQVTATVMDPELSNRFSPLQSALSADGNTLVVLNVGTDRNNGALAVMNVPALAFRSNIKAPAPFYGPFVLTPDGRHVYAVTGKTATGIVEIDVQTGATLANLPVHAGALALSVDGSTLYAANSSLEVIDTATNQIINQIPLPATTYRPSSLAVNPVSNTAYYSYQDSAGQSFVSAIDLTGRTNPRSIAVAAPVSAMVVSADGSRLLVGYSEANLVLALDSKAGHVVGSIELPGLPLLGAGFYHPAVVSPGGDRVFVPFDNYAPSQGGLAIADTSTLRVVNSTLINGRSPLSVAVSPDGTTVYVPTLSLADGTTDIEVFDASSLAVKAIFPIDGVNDLLVSRDGKFLYVSQGYSVAKVNATTGQVVASISFAPAVQETALVLSPSGATLYISSENFSIFTSSIGVVATDSFSQTTTLPFCGLNLALSPDGNTLYSDGCGGPGNSDTVNIIDVNTGALRGTADLPLIFTHLAVTPDGKYLWVSGESNVTSVAGIVSLDVATGSNTAIHTFSNRMVAFAGAN